MAFGIEECACLVIKRGKMVTSQGMEMPVGKTIESLEEGQSSKLQTEYQQERGRSLISV